MEHGTAIRPILIGHSIEEGKIRIFVILYDWRKEKNITVPHFLGREGNYGMYRNYSTLKFYVSFHHRTPASLHNCCLFVFFDTHTHALNVFCKRFIKYIYIHSAKFVRFIYCRWREWVFRKWRSLKRVWKLFRWYAYTRIRNTSFSCLKNIKNIIEKILRIILNIKEIFEEFQEKIFFFEGNFRNSFLRV